MLLEVLDVVVVVAVLPVAGALKVLAAIPSRDSASEFAGPEISPMVWPALAVISSPSAPSTSVNGRLRTI